ncbi:MAG: GNAT family N-acetyltransferase [Kangiellaceae bacterium]|nr:GNAT family N-acetyltransferase [Kangiellaceae bacterium]
MIRDVLPSDASAIVNIYNHYVLNSVVTFELDPITIKDMSQRIETVSSSELPWVVATENEQVVGYAYGTKWKERAAYRFSVETTVYLDPGSKKKGWGTKLYNKLFNKLEEMNVHLAIGGITLPNEASIALHEKLGMTQVAHFNQIGFKFDQWLDVGYWQKVLNSPNN